MPQIGLGGQAAMSGLLQGLIGGYGQQRQQSMERERKGQEDELKNLTTTLTMLQKHSPDDPRIPVLVERITEKRIGDLGIMPQQRMGRLPFPALGQERPIRTPQVREAFIETGVERAGALTRVGRERVTEITTGKREEKATLRKRAEQLMKQRRDFLRGDPIMTALGGLIEPQWTDETEGVELNNILSDLNLRHKFTYPKSVMDALKLTREALGPPTPLDLQQDMRDKETGEIVPMRWNGTEWVKIE